MDEDITKSFETSPQDSLTTVCYTIKGDVVPEDSKHVYAKKVTNDTTGNNAFFVKTGRGRLFDPWGTYANKINSFEFLLKRVSDAVFRNYVKYLDTRNGRFLISAERYMFDV